MDHSSNNESAHAGSKILACGYRKILIPKTAATFPAFLVSFPEHGNSFWRSKRDFLILARLVKGDLSLPKAAFKKLADRSPWRAPGGNVACDGSEDNFHVSMKKSLNQMNHFLANVQGKASNRRNKELHQAWDEFSRPENTTGLVSEDEEAHVAKSGRIRDGSRLGQYFCTNENARAVVNVAIQKLNRMDLLSESKSIAFVEPSCGNGDIVKALVDILAGIDPPIANVTIQGFDIDSHSISRCKGLKFTTLEVSWSCEDFLDTKRQATNDSIVVCVGGPPYSAGAGNAADMKLDLPTKFVKHCVTEWQANVVSFLLPERYRDVALDLPNGWGCETVDLSSSTFFFQGDTPVTQPSILQCFFRAIQSDGTNKSTTS